MKIVTIVGARPQLIKASAVSRAIRAFNAAHPGAGLEEVLVHTGQHFDHCMSDIFIREMDIPIPQYNLGIREKGHGAMTGTMLRELERVLERQAPDLVLVYGDTNSTLAGALAAVKLHLPVAHVEAGLRSRNRRMPEEINRVMADHVSSLLFCPTRLAVDNLLAEGMGREDAGEGTLFDKAPRVLLVGDVMFDTVLHFAAASQGRAEELLRALPRGGAGGYALCTVHRAENTDHPRVLADIFAALEEISRSLPVILPLHPRTRERMAAQGLHPSTPGLYITEPVGYLELLDLLRGASLVLTDSGGLQKEAFFLARPCVTLRGETEWTETVQAGWNRVAGGERGAILVAALSGGWPQGAPPTVFGDGRAAERIVEEMVAALA